MIHCFCKYYVCDFACSQIEKKISTKTKLHLTRTCLYNVHDLNNNLPQVFFHLIHMQITVVIYGTNS